jgi:hypothetical protein
VTSRRPDTNTPKLHTTARSSTYRHHNKLDTLFILPRLAKVTSELNAPGQNDKRQIRRKPEFAQVIPQQNDD